MTQGIVIFSARRQQQQKEGEKKGIKKLGNYLFFQKG